MSDEKKTPPLVLDSSMALPDEVPSENQKKAERRAKKAELEAKNPKRKIGLVVANGEEFWIRSPTRQQWHSFREAIGDPKRNKAAMENLTIANCVDPDGAAISDRIIEGGEPALAQTLADKIAILGGMDQEAEMVDFSDL